MNKIIEFGNWPQSIMAAEVKICGGADEQGFFCGSDGRRYGMVYDDYHKVNNYFLVEPIKWRVMGQKQGGIYLLCENILAASMFGYGVNDYQASIVRKWLNEEFYQKAFNNAEKAQIITATVENGVKSTLHDDVMFVCPDTHDKIFLPSAEEAFKTFGITARGRQKRPTPYSRALGVRMESDFEDDNGFGWWWLRSPEEYTNWIVQQVDHFGGQSWWTPEDEICGVVPAMIIKER